MLQADDFATGAAETDALDETRFSHMPVSEEDPIVTGCEFQREAVRSQTNVVTEKRPPLIGSAMWKGSGHRDCAFLDIAPRKSRTWKRLTMSREHIDPRGSESIGREGRDERR
jgi:hypothetical protein